MSLKHENELHEIVHSTPVNTHEAPFWVSEYGITFPNDKYHELRMHSDICCLEYIISGSGIVNSDNSTFFVSEGDSYMLLSGRQHNYFSNSGTPFKKIWINFKGNLALDIIKNYQLENVVLFKNINCCEHIEKIHSICENTSDPREIQDKTSAEFLRTIQFLSKNYDEATSNNNDIQSSIKYYIDCHIADNTKLTDIAKQFNYTTDHIIRLFKASNGVTPHQYILRKRIDIAKSMLRQTLSASIIASQLNFSNVHNFSATFKKITGVSPTEYSKAQPPLSDPKKSLKIF